MSTLNNKLIENGSYIDGAWLTESDSTFNVNNPANGELIATLADASVEQTQLAVDAATKALKPWQAFSAKKRSKILRRWYDLVIENKQALAEILTAEQGKPVKESLGEIVYGANFIEWFAEEAKRVYGDTIPGPSADKKIVVMKQAVGVVSAITPWNFPSSMITRKAAPALAAGCTFVIKPAAETPLSAIALAQLAHEAGIPKGVFNVVVSTNAIEVGKILTGDPRIGKFSFTGSTPVGKILLKQCADTVKKTTMELGGNAPFIVFDDADIEKAVDGLMASKYRNAGQTCVCTNRVFVQSSIEKQFIEKLSQHVKELTVGEGTTDVDIGPLINRKALEGVDNLVKDAISEGAIVEFGGKEVSAGSNFYEPTILSNVSQSMRIAASEIFGPIASVISFDTEDEVIEYANDTEFGLASYVFTRDIGRVWRMSEHLEYGMVGINTGMISNEMAPFGGVKQSGMGREGSKYGIEDYLEPKYVCMGGLDD